MSITSKRGKWVMAERKNLNVLLVDHEADRIRQLTIALHKLGHQVICHSLDASNLNQLVAQVQPDIVIIDMDSPDRDTLESMAAMSRDNPRPIVFFAEQQNDHQTMAAAINAGVSAYIADGIQPDRVTAIMDTAIAHFKAHSALRQELAEVKGQLEGRQIIEQAKGLLMKHQGCDEEQAFKTLRKLAMDRGQKLPQVAASVIEILQPTQRS